MSNRHIARLHGLIARSIYDKDAPLDYDRLCDALIRLAEVIEQTDDTKWYIGESGFCCLDNLIVGAYWHFCDWHGGQWSKGYATLCALGRIFDPGMTSLDHDSGEYDVYQEMDRIAESHFKVSA